MIVVAIVRPVAEQEVLQSVQHVQLQEYYKEENVYVVPATVHF